MTKQTDGDEKDANEENLDGDTDVLTTATDSESIAKWYEGPLYTEGMSRPDSFLQNIRW